MNTPEILTCRLCLRDGYDFLDVNVGDPSYRIKILVCMPEIDVHAVKKPVVCGSCCYCLDSMFLLKNISAKTEAEINKQVKKLIGKDKVDIRGVPRQHPAKAELRAEIIPVINNIPAFLPNQEYRDAVTNTSRTYESDSSTSSSAAPGYTCRTCKLSFTGQYDLDRHIAIHLVNQPHQCKACNKCFSLKANLEIHKRIHTESRPYNCIYCSKTFSTNGNLKIHLRVHTGEKPYKCGICDVQFTQKSQLNLHMIQIHSVSTETFPCSVCGKQFTLKTRLEIHFRTHTNEKPFSCSTCGKCFSTKGNLTTHIRVHTGEKPYACNICDMRFNQKGPLNLHRNLHVKVEKDQSKMVHVSHFEKDPLTYG